jgi:hypothetical protein
MRKFRFAQGRGNFNITREFLMLTDFVIFRLAWILTYFLPRATRGRIEEGDLNNLNDWNVWNERRSAKWTFPTG